MLTRAVVVYTRSVYFSTSISYIVIVYIRYIYEKNKINEIHIRDYKTVEFTLAISNCTFSNYFTALVPVFIQPLSPNKPQSLDYTSKFLRIIFNSTYSEKIYKYS